jgi:flagellar hook-associated protein 2
MATITSLGIGTGTDLNSIVTQLVAVERAPLRQLQQAATRLNTEVSAFGKVTSLFSALQDASNKLNGVGLWNQSNATSGIDAAVGVVGGATAAAGNYSVSVQALASSQTVASNTSYASATTLVGSGSLSIQLGAWSTGNTAFTAKSGSAALSVTLTATDTITSLRDKINAAGAGVTASLVTDATGVRLALRSSTSGVENGFEITGTGGVSGLSYNAGSGAGGLQLKQAAADAKATVNGIDITSATNELSGTIEGLTLKLRQVTTAPVDVAVTNDRDAITKAVTEFAKAYSELSAYIIEQTKYDAGTKQGGVLQGDSAVNNLQSRLRAIVNTPSGASAQFGRLSDVGLELQRDGTMKVNSTKLASATQNLTELKKAFGNSDTVTAGNDGFSRQFASLATRMLSIDGAVTTHTEGLRKLISKNGEDQTKLNERVDRFQARLTAQYSAMDVAQSRFTALSNYVNQQFGSGARR